MNQPVFPVYFENYVKLVNETDPLAALTNQQSLVDEYFLSIPEDASGLAYAEGKWNLKEMLQHLIDTERIMAYRALAFARGEKASLPGFDENAYAENSFASARNWKALIEELQTLRKSTLQLFTSFHPSTLENIGVSNGKEASTGAMGLIIVGHLYHHKNVIDERYRPLF